MISVLRLGHRKERDKRITTHCALVARAFGADEIVIDGDEAKETERAIEHVNSVWGGNFRVKYGGAKEIMRQYSKNGFKIVHLTMYGLNFLEKNTRESLVKKLKEKDILVVIGGKKVPPYVYKASHYNVSIGNQPHSEVAALAIFLNYLGVVKEFKGKYEIIPSNGEKKVVKKEK
jgi:tRNA (cytidine56-2'-O)-methyltransferase